MGINFFKLYKSRVNSAVFKGFCRLSVEYGAVFKVFFIYIFCVLAGNEKGKVSVKGNGNGVFGKQLAPGRGSRTADFTEDIINLSELDVYGAICGKAIYTGALDLKMALQVSNRITE